MIEFPTSAEGLTVPDGAVARAGGTDLQERLRSMLDPPTIVDLTDVEGFTGIEVTDEGTRIAAGATLAAVARELAGSHPALALAAGSLATPQIRARATIGGSLTQRTRCWYYRHPGIDCFKSGGDTCPARSGRHLYGVVFDNSACVHPHPSTTAMALLACDASVTLASGRTWSMTELLGDGVDPTRDHLLPADDVITGVVLPPPAPRERAAYFRSIGRFEAEWPLVEAVVRARFDGTTIVECGVGLGGVATVPLRMSRCEERLIGSQLDPDVIAAASGICADGASPLPETGYKVDLIAATVTEVLERLRRHAVEGPRSSDPG